MKLYKIIKLIGDHGVSVFPPADQELPESEELAGEPMTELIQKIMFKGYTNHEARLALTTWAYHAKFDLNQAARGVRVYCEMCVSQIPMKAMPAEPITWGIIFGVAVIAAVALGLYVWAALDQEFNVYFGAHEWAYLMTYEQQLWQGEVFAVSSKQEGVYEQGTFLGEEIQSIDRNLSGELRADWIWLKPGGLVLEGRKPILYHVYRFTSFKVYFCGLMEHWFSDFYRLREGGDDPYKPVGVWTRPGGRHYQDTYEGCWGEWFWL